MTTILFDVDGVLADFSSRVLDVVREETGRHHCVEDLTSWSIRDSLDLPADMWRVVTSRIAEPGRKPVGVRNGKPVMAIVEVDFDRVANAPRYAVRFDDGRTQAVPHDWLIRPAGCRSTFRRTSDTLHCGGIGGHDGEHFFVGSDETVTWGPPFVSEPKSCPSEATLDALAEEVARARAKFPGSRFMLAALTEEVGELAQALLQRQGLDRIRKEALQVACCAIRLYEEGDPTFDDLTNEEAKA